MRKALGKSSRFRLRPCLEPLEARRLLSITVDEFDIPTGTVGLAAAPDGSLWFPLGGQELGKLNVSAR